MLERGKIKINKKGQVSVFIVIALLIIGVVIIGYAFRERISSVINTGGSSEGVSSEISEINSAIKTCVKQRAIDAVRLIGLQGGYVNLPDKYLKTNISVIAYGYYDGKNILASKETIEKEISYYVQLTMPYCIGSEFNDFNITKSEARVSTKINLNSVSVSAKMPVSVAREKNTFFLDRKYEIKKPIRLGSIVDIANNIINKQAGEKGYIPITYLTEFKFDVTFTNYNEDTLIYIITDNQNNETYNFMFGVDLK